MAFNYNNEQNKSLIGTDKVISYLQNHGYKGQWEQIEGRDNNFFKALDFCGVDWLWKTPKGKIYPVAFRCRYGNNWRSFTLRQREIDIERECQLTRAITPSITIQSHFDNDRCFNLLSIGIINTLSLINFCLTYSNELVWRTSGKSGDKFCTIDWDVLTERNCSVNIFDDIDKEVR